MLSNNPAEVCPPVPFHPQCAFHYSTWNSYNKMQGWQGVPRFKSVGLSFTGQFTIKAGESNSKGLKSTERIIIVQSEHIFCYTTKLHHNVVSWGEKDSETNNFTVKQRKKKPNPPQTKTHTSDSPKYMRLVYLSILSHQRGLKICSLE